MAETLLIALGSNLPGRTGRPPLESCRWAVKRLANVPGLELKAVSAWYRTAPVPVSDQPDFINGVARLSGGIGAGALLAALHEIENEAGRVRDPVNAAGRVRGPVNAAGRVRGPVNAAGRVRGPVNAARVLDLDLLAIDDQIIDRPGLKLPHPRLAERAFVLYPLCDVAPEWIHPQLGRSAAELRDALAPQRMERLAP